MRLTDYATVFVRYCDIEQSNNLTGTGGDIDADPHFANAPYDVTLSAGSPCIGAGDPAQAGTKDINGAVRFNPPTIGANEGYSLVVTNANAAGSGSLSGVVLAAQSAPDAVITFDPFFFEDFRPITPAATLELSQSVEIIAPAAGVAVSGGNSQGVFQVDSGVQAILTGLTIDGRQRLRRRRRRPRQPRRHGDSDGLHPHRQQRVLGRRPLQRRRRDGRL